MRIALDVKKHLVDAGRLDITQEELEGVLFATLRQRGYGDDYVRRYSTMADFYRQKRPLIILIAGSACTGGCGGRGGVRPAGMGGGFLAARLAVMASQGGRQLGHREVCGACKQAACCSQQSPACSCPPTTPPPHCPAGKSTLAQQLASRLNLPNVLQTDVLCEVRRCPSNAIVCAVFCRRKPTTLLLLPPPTPLAPCTQLLRTSGASSLPTEPLWQRDLGQPPEGDAADAERLLVREFQRECTIIRRALDGDLCKVTDDVPPHPPPPPPPHAPRTPRTLAPCRAEPHRGLVPPPAPAPAPRAVHPRRQVDRD